MFKNGFVARSYTLTEGSYPNTSNVSSQAERIRITWFCTSKLFVSRQPNLLMTTQCSYSNRIYLNDSLPYVQSGRHFKTYNQVFQQNKFKSRCPRHIKNNLPPYYGSKFFIPIETLYIYQHTLKKIFRQTTGTLHSKTTDLAYPLTVRPGYFILVRGNKDTLKIKNSNLSMLGFEGLFY